MRFVLGFCVFAIGCGGSSSESVDGGGLGLPPDAALRDPLAGIGTPQLVATLPTPAGGVAPFLEGPAWNAATGTLLFSDIPNSTIHELTLPNAISDFRSPSGAANGLFFDAAGLLYAAEHEGRRISRTEANGDVVDLVTMFDGSAFHSPNDLVITGDGTVYFTDPPFGGNPAELGFNGVFRYTANGTIVAEEELDPSTRPNGIALSPDGTRLYMADTTGVFYSYDVAADGALVNRVTLDDTRVAGADGMAIDADGNIWLTTSDGIDVFSASGAHLGTVTVPQTPSNCAFGGEDGKTLYITARTGLYALPVTIPGLGFAPI